MFILYKDYTSIKMSKIEKIVGDENFQKIVKYRKGILDNRNELIDLLPIDQPFSVTIGLTNRCNFGCVFCPTGDLELVRKSKTISTGMMPDKVFYKIIDDILLFKQKLKKISLTGLGEPFLHKNFLNFSEYIRQKNATEKISVTTNGSLLHRFDNKRLAKSLDEIIFSIEHVHAEGYKKITRNFKNFNLIKENIKNLYNIKKVVNPKLKIHIKILDIDLSEEEKKNFFEIFGKYADTMNIDFAQSFTHSDKHDFSLNANKDDKTKDGFEKNNEKNMICSQLFMYLKTVWNGNVIACCADWKQELIIGNIFKNTLEEIWNGPELNKLRVTHIYKSQKDIGPCANCDYIKNIVPKDNLTPHREKLKKIYR